LNILVSEEVSQELILKLQKAFKVKRGGLEKSKKKKKKKEAGQWIKGGRGTVGEHCPSLVSRLFRISL